MPDILFEQVKAAWSDHLSNCLPGGERLTEWKAALPAAKDFDRFANNPVHLFSKLPKRIRVAVINAERKRAKEIHDEFFASGGNARIKQLLKVVQSQRIAHSKLMIQALGYKRKEGGGASIGETPIDLEHMLLTEAEATGSAMKVGHLLPYIKSLWEADKTILVKKPGSKAVKTLADWEGSFERRVIPNPDQSEERLNRFLIKLGRALADKSKRRDLPDWIHLNQTIRFVVEGWCQRIEVDGEPWPMLCLLSTPALAKFLTLCNPPRWQANQDPRTLERAIQRYGLVRIQSSKIRRVEKKFGRVHLG